MRPSLNRNFHESPGINGTSVPGPEQLFRPALAGAVLRVIYPGLAKETEAQVARICRFTDRQARDVINGTAPMPGPLLADIMVQLTRRPPKPPR